MTLDEDIEACARRIDPLIPAVTSAKRRLRALQQNILAISLQQVERRNPDGSLILDANGQPQVDTIRPKGPLFPNDELTDDQRRAILTACTDEVAALRTLFGIT